MKKLNILFTTVILLTISCKVSKETKTDKFFEKWEQDSKAIPERKSPSKIEIAIKEIADIELCENYNEDKSKNFPKLKYFIAQERINVSMSENLNASIGLFSKDISSFSSLLERFVFEDSTFHYKINCSNNSYKPLILTNKYQKKITGKLKYGFGSYSFNKNRDNARVLLDSRGGKYFGVSFKISDITFNKSMDSAIVTISDVHHGYGKLYTNVNNSWNFKKKVWHLVE